MGAPNGINFCTNYTSGAPATIGMPADQPSLRGGRYALVVSATTYPTQCKLQYIQRNAANAGANIDIQVLNSNGMTILDLPAGQYQVFMSGGAAANLSVDLASVPQD